jgi:hypothetical protein
MKADYKLHLQKVENIAQKYDGNDIEVALNNCKCVASSKATSQMDL